MRRFFIITASLLMLIGCCILYREKQDEFTLENISFDNPLLLTWDEPQSNAATPEDFTTILNQTYSYLDKGHQSYVFESADNKYVLKLIKFTYLKPSKILNWLPNLPFIINYRHQVEKGQLKRFQRVLTGYQLAFDLDKENSGVIYIHFQKSNNLNTFAHIIDKAKVRHEIDLDQMYFIIQKKGVMTRNVLYPLLKNNNITAAKQRIRQIFDLYASQYQKGLYDSDHNVMNNTGFVGDQAIRLDLGRLKQIPLSEHEYKNFIEEDLNKIAYERFSKWIKNNFPLYYEELMKDIEDKLNEILKK